MVEKAIFLLFSPMSSNAFISGKNGSKWIKFKLQANLPSLSQTKKSAVKFNCKKGHIFTF